MNNVRIYNLNKYPNIRISIEGKNNVINLSRILGNGKLVVKVISADNCHIEIDSGNIVNNGTLTILAVNQPGKKVEGSCIIGKNNMFNGDFQIKLPLNKNNSVKIGSDNLFARAINIVGCAEHLVYDVITKERYNLEQGVEIGDKIWIGAEALLLNKAKISNGSIVATRCVVTKKFDTPNLLIAGVPGKVKKSNVSWNKFLDDSYLQD